MTKYVGVDPNDKMIPLYDDMVSELRKIQPMDFEYTIHTVPFEDLDEHYQGEFDMMFTSPPYFNIEEYNVGVDKGDVHNRYSDIESFFDGFIAPSMLKVSNMVRDDGLIAIVMSNTQKYNLTGLFNEGCVRAGMTLIEAIPYVVMYDGKIGGAQYIMMYVNSKNNVFNTRSIFDIKYPPYVRFMDVDAPDLKTERMIIRQVTPEMISQANDL